ncbi:Flp family type IVb pilin [Fulvimonas sp. R45]|uniref:Flp family type IVb pilin n=1 Tax=Fulvimonas sp. R45 TaxID=3045937 RepID=UPI00265DBAA0|nr:Flp family type IVb pilin [Fulvimonas sp. R45]MDO1528438.1 Flp family type IVb pilin [Fulvimonas sp. R45]
MNMSIRKFLAEEDGITALEYGILAAIVAGIIVTAFKDPLTNFFKNLWALITTNTGISTTS